MRGRSSEDAKHDVAGEMPGLISACCGVWESRSDIVAFDVQLPLLVTTHGELD